MWVDCNMRWRWASRAACDSMRRLEVWVAGGTYTDYKGFVIRDSVTVKGGFPDADTGSPGESERRPLLAKGIPLNDENSDYADRIADYETILQIQVDSPVTVTDAVNGRYTVSAGLPSNIRKYVLFQPDVCRLPKPRWTERIHMEIRVHLPELPTNDGTTT